MKIFISVVSHNHGKLIKQLSCLQKIACKHNVVLKDNVGEQGLKRYCDDNNMAYIGYDQQRGFGENNNIVHKFCTENLDMKSDDIFIILNPDVVITLESLDALATTIEREKYNFATINLYKDKDFEICDPCIRKFPSFKDFLSSYLGFENKTVVNKSQIFEPIEVDWAAGSFLAVKSSYFNKVNGFNPKYFMYCEDIDFCMRMKSAGAKLIFIPDIKAMHLARHNNRKFLSKHFYWHLRSMFIYLLEKRKYA
ncbi:glycosyltransferase family 2 protein [Enterobacter hormaechei]|nr:glycosyltransferase family 2 protein [Enterobacter hormaechei]